MASGFMQTLEEHPVLIGGAVILVAVFALMHASSGASGSSGGVQVYGNTPTNTIDPNVAAIQQAQIQAGTANIASIGGIINSVNTANDETTASLASTSANLESSLAATEAEQEIEDSRTAASVTMNTSNNAAAISAAGITAETQRQQTAAALAAAKANDALQQQLGQFKKDIARAQDNTNVFGDILNFGKSLLAYL